MPQALMTCAVVAVSGAALVAQDHVPRQFRTLIDAEHRFAALSVEQGARTAFLTLLDRQAILFRPEPVNGWDSVAEQPLDEVELDWAPSRAEVSAAGDLGVTIGVWRRTSRNGEVSMGHYVTVWQRNIEGAWRVAIDIGTTRPGDVGWPSGVVTGVLASRAASRLLSDARWTSAREALLDADRELAPTVSRSAYEARAHEDVQAHRTGRAILNTRQAVARFVADEALSLTQSDGRIARSADLGYTYGSARITDATGESSDGGYLRLWTRGEDGRWVIVVDVVTQG